MRKILCGISLLLALGGLQAAGAQEHCRDWKANEAGTSRAEITVGATAVLVVPANTSSCGCAIENVSTVDMMCDSATNGLPTSTTGKRVRAGAVLTLGMESQKQINCIRVTTDATASVACGRP